MIYTWRKGGADHYLEIVLGEDEKTVATWRFWASLEPRS